MRRIRVKHIMTEVVETLMVGDTIAMAEWMMREGRIRHLPVIDAAERVIGLVTHRKLLGLWLSHGRPELEAPGEVASGVPVEMIMERDVLTVEPDAPAAVAARLIESHRFGCLPVVKDDKLVGIVTEADFVHLARRYLEGTAPRKPNRKTARKPPQKPSRPSALEAPGRASRKTPRGMSRKAPAKTPRRPARQGPTPGRRRS